MKKSRIYFILSALCVIFFIAQDNLNIDIFVNIIFIVFPAILFLAGGIRAREKEKLNKK